MEKRYCYCHNECRNSHADHGSSAISIVVKSSQVVVFNFSVFDHWSIRVVMCVAMVPGQK